MNTTIRMATPADAEAIRSIYAPFITETCVSFETEVPALDNFQARISNILQRYPFFVYECDGLIVGYAYASKHRERAAYHYSVDVSVYIAPEYHRKGIGKKLYSHLFAWLKEKGYYTAFAGIALPNESSVGLHQLLGFSVVGVYHHVGYKHGKWVDVMWLEKPLREYDDFPIQTDTI